MLMVQTKVQKMRVILEAFNLPNSIASKSKKFSFSRLSIDSKCSLGEKLGFFFLDFDRSLICSQSAGRLYSALFPIAKFVNVGN